MCSNVAPAPSARRPPSFRRAGSERRPGRTVTGSPGPRRPAPAAPPPPRPEPAAPAGTPAAPRANNTGVPREAARRGPCHPRAAGLTEGVEPQAARDNPAGERERGGR